MPRIEITAQWRKPDGIYESMIGSITMSELALGNPEAEKDLIDRIKKLIADTVQYEAGEPTDMAQKVYDNGMGNSLHPTATKR